MQLRDVLQPFAGQSIVSAQTPVFPTRAPLVPAHERLCPLMIRFALPILISAVALAGCAAHSGTPAAEEASQRCVVSTEPGMKMVTLAEPAGLAAGVTSLFFATMPDVHPGDLVRVDNSAGNGGPEIERIEASSEACRAVTQTAEDTHKHHQ